MEMDWKTNMAELGGAFMVSWFVLGEGNAVMMGVLLAVTMAAMAGAHVLPLFTWISAMTGDLQDTDAWMGNVMRLVMQMVGAGAALALAGEGTVEAAADGVAMWEFDLWPMLTMLAAGAILATVASRCDGWMTAFAVVILAGHLGAGVSGADGMAAELMGGGDIVEMASHWIVDGVVIGLGAMLGGMLEDQL
ncbi:MAG: hypothetical protein MKZ53_00725 [Candidatus Thalassarchaeum sp.]|nr:hypothetical protein [Candidatus Thalassarchaeum sp.]